MFLIEPHRCRRLTKNVDLLIHKWACEDFKYTIFHSFTIIIMFLLRKYNANYYYEYLLLYLCTCVSKQVATLFGLPNLLRSTRRWNSLNRNILNYFRDDFAQATGTLQLYIENFSQGKHMCSFKYNKENWLILSHQ